MIVTLNQFESDTLDSLDPQGKGQKQWANARSVAVDLFPKKKDSLGQAEIRTIRNAFRKLVREELIEIGEADKRGQYCITERGRKIRNGEEMEFEGLFERGKVGKATEAQVARRLKSRPVHKTAEKKEASSKTEKKTEKTEKTEKTKKKTIVKAATDKETSKKKVSKKAPKKRVGGPKTDRTLAKKAVKEATQVAKAAKAAKAAKKTPTPFTVENKSETKEVVKSKDGNSGSSNTSRRKFRRRQAPAAYGESSSS